MAFSQRGGDIPSWVDDASLDFAQVLRLAIRRRGLTLARAHARMAQAGDAVSIATLSHWQSGRSLPERRISRDALHSLERILDLPVGTLTGALGRTEERRRAEAAQPTDVAARLHGADRVRSVLDSAGIALGDGFTRVSVIERLRLDAKGRPSLQHVVMTLRAEIDGAQTLTAFQTDVAGRHGPGRFEAVLACELASVHSDASRRVTVGSFRLFGPLARGDLVTISYATTYPPSTGPLTSFGRVHRTAVRDAVLEVVFHPDRRPQRVEQFYEPADSPGFAASDPLRAAATFGQRPVVDGTAQSYFSNRRPGLTGLRWWWPGSGDGREAVPGADLAA